MTDFPGRVRCVFRALVLLAIVVLAAVPARAHPHVWIDARADVIFEDGAVSAIRHHWQFDEAFSAWANQGLDANGDGAFTDAELQPLAVENTTGLDAFQYHTYAGEGRENLVFGAVQDPAMTNEAGRNTLSFTIPLEEPHAISERFEIEVGDPEYYIAFTFADAPDAVRLIDAPADCRADVNPPQPIDPDLAERLWSLGPEVTELPADLQAAARDRANVVTIACGPPETPTALDAVEAVAAASPTPFSAPPSEPGMNPGQGGVLGWIATQQRLFYAALTDALSALRTDGNAFWVLGGLSFLYGVFHAAGPGHGKMVISSYVLANERQLRRGLVLSFLAAMLQAAVAVAFVVTASALLRLTAARMSDAANWMAVASYGLIVVLGAVLVVRKLLALRGGGHHHHHHGAHGHDHHHHEHIVTPETAGGGWREGLTVVLAVGLRPCSGALVVLVFALTQGLLAAGVASAFLMGIGTAITVSVLAVAAVMLKGAALRMGGEGALAGRVVWGIELVAALGITSLGVVLMLPHL